MRNAAHGTPITCAEGPGAVCCPTSILQRSREASVVDHDRDNPTRARRWTERRGPCDRKRHRPGRDPPYMELRTMAICQGQVRQQEIRQVGDTTAVNGLDLARRRSTRTADGVRRAKSATLDKIS